VYPGEKANRLFKGKILKQCLNVKKRYYALRLSKQGKTKLWLTHQLVANAFLGLRPKNYLVCHGPKGPLCNEVSNLSWGTPKDNSNDKIRDGTLLKGSEIHCAKLTEQDVLKIRQLAKEATLTQTEIAVLFGVSTSTINEIIHKKRWKHV
jgi:predicted XRE-type DNA-binding protein